MGCVDGSSSIFVKLKKYGSAKACNEERTISLTVWKYSSFWILPLQQSNDFWDQTQVNAQVNEELMDLH